MVPYVLFVINLPSCTLDSPLPSFKDVDCPVDAGNADICILVEFALAPSDLLILFRQNGTSTIYEGFLGSVENQVPVVMIEEEE